MSINALLDDISSKTYINSDVAAELGFQGEKRGVTVNVPNGQTRVPGYQMNYELNLVVFGMNSSPFQSRCVENTTVSIYGR